MKVRTNTVEGYYTIFKRGMKGVYQHCEEKHLHRYVPSSISATATGFAFEQNLRSRRHFGAYHLIGQKGATLRQLSNTDAKLLRIKRQIAAQENVRKRRAVKNPFLNRGS